LEGQILLKPSKVKTGGFSVEQINEGNEEHELAFYIYPQDKEIRQINLGNLNSLRMKASIRPLDPGESDVTTFGGNYFGIGRYIILCLNRTQNGESHISLGEITEFTVE